MRDPAPLSAARRAADAHGTPLTLLDADALDARAAEFEDAARAASREVELYASYKTNPLPAALRRLHARGWGAELISDYELWLAARLDAPRLILNGPARTPALLRDALDAGALVNANHLEEIDALERAAAERGIPARVGVRVSAPDGWGAQLGVRPEDADAAFARVRASSHLELDCVHVHRGRELRALEELDALLDFVAPLAARAGCPKLDLGGSLGARVRHLSLQEKRAARDGVPPVAGDPPLPVADYLARVDARLPDGLTLLLEPGRALFAEAQHTITSVRAVRRDHEPPLAVCDVGIHLAGSVAHEHHEVVCLDRAGDDEVSRLVGPICTPGDVLVQAWRGPRLDVGDRLLIRDTGAYVLPFETTFAFPRPPVVVVEGGELSLARRRESFEDLVARDLEPG